MPSRSRPVAPSALLGEWLDLEEGTELQIVAATTTIAFAAVELWSESRRPRLVNWSWPRFVHEYPEAMALVDAVGTPRALFCSRRRRLLKLPAGLCYELGYVEVHPNDRGGQVGYYAFAVAAARALEIGARGMVLGAINEAGLLRFYVGAGGKSAKIKGWEQPLGLVPFFFSEAVLTELEEDVNAARKTKASDTK